MGGKGGGGGRVKWLRKGNMNKLLKGWGGANMGDQDG
jgi:hypothetical protein